ncbi:MAG: NAD-dependent epimerase/dehydratase family protein [Pseudomonadota bacterium]
MTSKVLIAGSSGYIGRHLVQHLTGQDRAVVSVSRNGQPVSSNTSLESPLAVNDFSSESAWINLLGTDIDCVVYAAGRAHLSGKAADDLEAYYQANCAGALALAKAFLAAGGRRFVYLSSVSVYGESADERALTEVSGTAPVGHYALSKYDAERQLHALLDGTATELVIVRPPMVYGPGAPGNFASLARLVKTGLPLPFAGIDNRRSFIAIDNLLTFLTLCIDHSSAGHNTFVVTEGPGVSTTVLSKIIAEALGQKPRLFYFPRLLIQTAAGLLGRGAMVEKLWGDFELYDGKARHLLGWSPPVTTRDAVHRALNSA